MSIYPHGDLWPLQVRVMAAHLEREALQQGLSARATEPPVARAPRKQSLTPQQTPRPAQRVVVRRTMQQRAAQRRMPVYRALALLVALIAAALFGVLGVYILRSDLPLFVAALTLGIFGLALALTEVWALPSFYRWAYWRWLLAWR